MGKLKGNVGFGNKKVGGGPVGLQFHQLLGLVQPASGRGKNFMCPRGYLPTQPACTKSPRMKTMFKGSNVCRKYYTKSNYVISLKGTKFPLARKRPLTLNPPLKNR